MPCTQADSLARSKSLTCWGFALPLLAFMIWPTSALNAMSLRRKIGENEDGVAELQRFIAGQEQEKRKVHQKFDTELAKLKVLWEIHKPVVLPAASGAQSGAASTAR